MTSFELNEDQEKKLNEWQEKIFDLFGEYGHYDYVFTPNGIGVGIVIVSHLAKISLNLSDVENW